MAGGDDIHLSESVGDCRVRTVKNYSYPYLTFVTLSVLGGFFFLFGGETMFTELPTFIRSRQTALFQCLWCFRFLSHCAC